MMAKLTKDTLFKAPQPRAETVMDKTTRVVREMLDTETEQREAKTQRLRKTRLEHDAAESGKTPASKSKTRKTPE